MLTRKLSRRRFLASTAVASLGIAAPYVRGAHAAGKLSMGFWDHWVPGANSATTALVKEWAEKEKVDVAIDYIPSQGNKLLITITAEAQARAGHDILAFPSWQPAIMRCGSSRWTTSWRTSPARMAPSTRPLSISPSPTASGSRCPPPWGQIKGPCSRIDLMKQHAGIDVRAMYPAGAPPRPRRGLSTLLKAAEACHKAGCPFGIGLGTTADSVDTVGAVFHAFGAALVDAKGNITVKSDPVRQALEYYTRLARFFPPDAPAWDDSSNNKWLVSGRGALIMNPPSAWAVAKRDAPQVAEQLWTHGMPSGPKGRYAPFVPYFWGIWNFGKQGCRGEEHARASVAASIGRKNGDRERRL
jgi:ABC-type glycerol-3-phosphate transport system substrate-binding protein